MSKGANQPDHKFGEEKARATLKGMPLCFSSFPAHSSPLGLEYFGSDFEIPELRNCFLVGLHGSGKQSLGRGYRIARLRKGLPSEDFITGFRRDGKVLGRPCDILRGGPDAFFFTDDLDGTLYYVRHKKTPG